MRPPIKPNEIMEKTPGRETCAGAFHLEGKKKEDRCPGSEGNSARACKGGLSFTGMIIGKECGRNVVGTRIVCEDRAAVSRAIRSETIELFARLCYT